jgi:hypothetical protein
LTPLTFAFAVTAATAFAAAFAGTFGATAPSLTFTGFGWVRFSDLV